MISHAFTYNVYIHGPMYYIVPSLLYYFLTAFDGVVDVLKEFIINVDYQRGGETVFKATTVLLRTYVMLLKFIAHNLK